MDTAAPPLQINNNLTSDGGVDRSSSPTAPDVPVQHGPQTGGERVCWASQSSSGLVVVTNEKQLAASETGTTLEALPPSLPLSNEGLKAALRSEGDTPERRIPPLDATQLASAAQPANDDTDFNPLSAHSEDINQNAEDVLKDGAETNMVNSADTVERVEALVETRLEEILDAQKVKGCLSGLEQTASSLQVAPASPNPPATPPLFDAGLVVSLQGGEVVAAETSDASEQVLAELVHAAAAAQEIVVVREEAHISGEWADVHLNRGYLLQRQDGSVCQAAIQLTAGDAKLYHDGVETEMELDEQPMEVYEFCELVEEVAEETVCASSSGGGVSVVQLPQSPGYEVNLFNALLENADEFTVKEDMEGDAIIISQQPLGSACGADLPSSGDLSNQNSNVAVGRRLLLDANQTVTVAHTSEVCLVQVAAITSESFTDGHTDSDDQTGIGGSQEPVAAGNSESLLDSSECQDGATEPGSTFGVISAVEDTAVSATINSSATQTPPPINQTPGVTVLGGESEVRLSLPEEKEEGVGPGATLPVLNQTLLLKPSEAPNLNPSPLPLAAVTNKTSAEPEECLTRPVPPPSASVSSSSSSSEPLSCPPDMTLTSVTPSTRSPLQLTSAALTQTSETPRSAKPEDRGPSAAAAGPVDDLEEEEEGEEEEEEEEEEDEEDEEAEASSPEEEEGSDEEVENKKSEMRSQRSSLQVQKWMADRAGVNSSPVSPSSSSSSYPGPSAACDWSTPRREKSSPLRGANGKFVSPSSICGFSPAASSPNEPASTPRPRGERHTDMAELAKHEADIELRTQALKREGFWALKRLGRLTEPPRPKVHWDYLCEEMQWLSADFAQERRWKRGVARKVVRMVMRHHEELRQKEEKAKRDEHAKIRRVASSIAKEVRAFWSSVEKVVQYKQQSRLEEKRKKALDLQLDFIVGQTEKYSHLLTKSLNTSRPPDATTPSEKPPQDEDDGDFAPPVEEEEDDEETIEVEEQQEGNDAESRRREIQLLKEEGLLPLDQLLSTLKLPPQKECEEEEEDSSDGTASTVPDEEEDGEFTANDEDAEDEEDTIAAQEKVEGDVNHREELDDLAREGDLSLEELLEKYRGAFTSSDPEAPSGCASRSSSDQEDSGEETEEDEREEDESDVETNSSSSDSAGDSADEEESEKDEGASEEEGEEEEECDEGMEVLLKEGDNSPPSSGSRPKKEISHIAATAESLQPKGYTLATTKVKTPIPFLLHGTLREYQHIGLEWLVTMYEKKLNGILADEMGLGKTIQTIALLAHLACEKGNWGPHLIIVPTSVMLNWEMELKRWCPGFKILTYFGSQKERKLKRQGWTKPNAFHVCITSYKLVLQDHQAFRRKSWRYLILDEAQNIKNFKSQRWQSLLNFNSHRRLLLTGTPLQNSLMELWSLMHFLMPHVFQSHREFKEWFSNPLTGMIEGSQEYNEGLVKRLHKVLRPFLLRRIKVDVEKQMPKKYEHVVRCRLSKRQRFLYDDFMAQASTRETLASGHFMSVINILMQLRKVCNHPNLFDPRPIQSPFITKPIVFLTASLVQDALDVEPLKRCDLSIFDLVGLERRVSRYQADVFLPRHAVTRQLIQDISDSPEPPPRPRPVRMKVNRMFQPPPKGEPRPVLLMNKPSASSPSVPTQTLKPSPPPPPPPPPTTTTTTTPSPSEVASPQPQPAPVVQQVVCTVAPSPCPRPPLSATQTAVRSSAPKPLLATCTPGIPAHPGPNPTAVMPQRVLLSPDMQARLPSGEVVSIAQLASLAGRPVSSCQGSKPVTFQLQGNKLTLSGAHIHQVPTAPPRTLPGNVMHLVSSGVQHHLITQPAQVSVQTAAAVRPTVATPACSTAPPTNRLPLNASSPAPASMVSNPGVVKIVVRQSSGKEGRPLPTLAMTPPPRVAPPSHPAPLPARPLQTAQRSTATAHYTLAPPRTPAQPPQPRPLLKVVQPPPTPHPPLPLPSGAEQPASSQVTSSSSTSSSSSVSKSSVPLQNATPTPSASKPRPNMAAKTCPPPRKMPRPLPRSPFHMPWLSSTLQQQRRSRLDFLFSVNQRRCGRTPVYGLEVLDFLTFLPSSLPSPAATWGDQEEEKEEGEERKRQGEGWWRRSGHSSCLLARQQDEHQNYWRRSHAVADAILTAQQRLDQLTELVDRFTFVIPPVEAPPLSMHCCHPPPSLSHHQAVFSSMLASQVAPLLTRSLHRIQCYMRTQFPDLRLIQYDCGKLQVLHTLLRKLKTGGHRVLIFTQMTRMLDVLEQFLNYHGHIYLRLDGSTRVEQRQALMERFNADRRIFCFILSTRSGGVGVNLTGADTVVFYDSDWNPTMDAQAQDRCHRIGQTRDVHIYRLISERTVEENILKKANQKRMLGDMAIEGGNFTTAFFKQQTIRELFDMSDGEKREAAVELSLPPLEEDGGNKQSTTILEQALCRAEDEEDIVAASQAKAEQVAELAEFNENIPLDDGGEPEEAEELSKAEQEIAALVEQLTPIERYAMNFLEASLEDVCKEELKQAEEQVEAARKGLDQAKEEGLKLHASSDDEDFLSTPSSAEPGQPAPARRGRKPKDKTAPSTRTSGRLRGASPETEPEPTPTREPERLRSGLRGRGATKTPTAAANPQKPSSARQQETNKSSKATSPPREQHAIKTRTNRTQPSQVTTASAATDSRRGVKEEEKERKSQESSLESATPSDLQPKDEDGHDAPAMSPPSTRSPRKRQSADVEVLRGLVEDSPSAKVLRKLPGRLVTVVEEKEPRRRRRRASGTGGGGSSEETAMEDNVEELNKDPTSSDPKPTATKPTEDQDSVPSVAPPPPPVRSYPPYSPPHLSPDMPVLRNLPVRRRLETESRMAAQLGEQLRGRAGNQSKKADAAPGRDATLTSTESNLNSLVTPLKRKRGRPPKTTLRSPESDQVVTPSPTSPSEEGTPTLSPKRRRGRPRKDSFTMSDAGDGLESEAQPELATATADTSGTPLPAAASRHRDAEGTTEDSPRGPAVAHQEKADEALEPAPLATPAASVLTTPVINTPAEPALTTPPLPSAPPPSQTVATSSPSDASSTSSVMPSPGGALMVTATTSTVPTPLVSAVDPTDSTVKSSELDSTPVNTSVATAATPSVVVRDSSSETPEATTASTSASIMLASSTTVDSAQLTTIKAASNSTPAPLASTAANQTLSSTQASSDSPKPAAASPAPVKTAQANPTISSTPVRTVLASSPNSTNTREAHQGSVAMAISEPSSTLSSAPIVNVLDQTPAAKAVEAPPQPDLTPPPTTEAPIGAPAEPLESLATSVAPPTSTRSVAPPAPMNTLFITKAEDTKTVLKEVEITETRQLSTSTPPTSKENSEQTPPTVTSPDIVSPTVSTASSPQVESTTSATTSSSSADMVHSNRALPPASITPVTSCVSSTSMPATVASEKESSESDSQRELAMEAKSEEATNRKKKRSSEDEADELQPKRRKTASSSRTKSDGEETRTDATAIKQKDETKQPEASVEGQKSSGQKQPISRQSSRESTRSSSPSSGCSSTLTRHAHHKRTYENRHPTKRRPADASDAGKEEEDGRTEEGGNQETDAARRRHRSSSCCSSDSDSNGSGGEELRVTRSAKRRLQDQEKESIKEKMPQPPLSLERNVTSNAIESPDGAEPGIETVRVTRKSATSQPPLDTKPQTNSVPPPPPEPEVLGKRCSALNAAAKLLAMKGRVDTPGHTPRKDSGSKTAADKTQNTKSKSAPATPQSNSLSLTNSKPSAAKPSSSNQTSRPASRSTRQCPGSLVPPLDLEYRRSKPEDRSATKSVEGDAVSSSRGHSASSSDGEGGGGRSSRSRSSSNSSQRTLSSQNTERRSSRAASSGSERDRERSLERARREGRSYRESRRSQRLVPEAAAVGGAGSGGGSGAEGTPDRVLRSVAALAAVQARSPAASTRSSASQQRHNKT